ncbi:MAG: hypothetical protein JXB13_09170 [Phycisphaerae bacterium]|nr:hypothetical protein [Phycisphaerae bacterium]
MPAAWRCDRIARPVSFLEHSPPAHICNDSPNGASALFAYVWEMQRWVDAARAGRAVDALIPVNVPPTVEWTGHLERRLDFIRKRLLVEYEREIVWDIGRYNELVEREDRSDKG